MNRNVIQHALRAGLTCLLATGLVLVTAAAPQQPPAQVPASQVPASQVPPAVPPGAPPPAGPGQVPAPAPAPATAPVPVAPPVPGTVVCPVPVPPATVPARSFTASAGMIFLQVIPARSADFDRFLAYVRDALAKTTNATVRKQAEGWTFHRAVEAGPNGDALYVFVMNPAVPCVDYALAPILSETYADPAQLLEIWKLYQTSVRPGSTLITLVPAPVVPLTPPLTPPTTTTTTPSTAQPSPGSTPPRGTSPAAPVPSPSTPVPSPTGPPTQPPPTSK